MTNDNNEFEYDDELVERYVIAFTNAMESSNPRENTNVMYQLMCDEISQNFADNVVRISCL